LGNKSNGGRSVGGGSPPSTRRSGSGSVGGGSSSGWRSYDGGYDASDGREPLGRGAWRVSGVAAGAVVAAAALVWW
jgi:hypothetical protein